MSGAPGPAPARPGAAGEVLLDVRGLRTVFRTDDGTFDAVSDVSFFIRAGETLCLVGESGCGKSVTALSLLRLVPSPPGRIAGGEIRWNGRDLLAASESEMRAIRGNEISMVFQEPMTALNPVYTVGDQIMEAVRLHQKVGRKEARSRAIEMLRLVGIPGPAERVDAYPHQLSGGMRQRAMIGMALACRPRLLIADEPTTALDVTVQAQILDLLRALQTGMGMAMLLITHDLGVVAENADRVAVMYGGRIVESAEVADLFASPRHPYTVGLLDSMPRLGERKEHLRVIPGTVPPPTAVPPGCAFHPRCPYAIERCRVERPADEETDAAHRAACHRWREVPALRAGGAEPR